MKAVGDAAVRPALHEGALSMEQETLVKFEFTLLPLEMASNTILSISTFNCLSPTFAYLFITFSYLFMTYGYLFMNSGYLVTTATSIPSWESSSRMGGEREDREEEEEAEDQDRGT